MDHRANKRNRTVYNSFQACENVCLTWQRIMKARSHLQSVKAEKYILRYEEELAESSIDFDRAYKDFKVAIDHALSFTDVNSNESSRSELIEDLAALMTVIETAVEESSIENFSYSTNDLLQAVMADVKKFATKYKTKTKMNGLVKYYRKPVVKKMSKNYQGRSIKALHSNIQNKCQR